MKKLFLPLILSLFAFNCLCQTVLNNDLKFVKLIEKDANIENAHFGLTVYDLDKEKQIISIHADKRFTPASNMKLFTALASLEILQDSIIACQYKILPDSSLLIKGFADPTFLNPKFQNQKLLKFLRKPNFKRIIIVDNEHIKYYGKGWMWDDVYDWYNQQLCLFPIYGNTLVAHIDSLQLHYIEPKIFEDSVTIIHSGKKEKTIAPSRSWSMNDFKWEISTIHKVDTFDIPFVWSMKLVQNSIEKETGKSVMVQKQDDIPSNGQWRQFYSFPIDSLLHELLIESDNFIGESLLLQASKILTDSFDVENAIPKILEKWSFIDKTKLRWVDGSGLSRYNQTSPNNISSILQEIYKQKGWQWITKNFATNNKEGTLKKLHFQNDMVKIYAKTGTLTDVHNLSGYLQSRSGNKYAFSILVNHHGKPNQTIRNSIANILEFLYKNY